MLSTRSLVAAAATVACLTLAPPVSAQVTFNELHRFSAPLVAGFAPLVEAPDGTLYGVMSEGGAGNAGAIVKLTPDGSGSFTFSILYQFSGPDGRHPFSLTYSAADGLLYGTTSDGGVDAAGMIDDGGTVFSLTTAGALTTLVDFDFDFFDPLPLKPAGLLEASDGNFYGTAAASSSGSGSGAVFKMDRSGTLQTLHTFSGTDGSGPNSVLVEGSDGRLYGTTAFGGANEAGTIFRIAKDGSGFTMLHEFSGPDGGGPSGLLRDTTGGSDLFYGVAGAGGTDSRGTMFTITPAGVFTLLASFGPDPDGASPVGPLVKGPDGLFYGVTGRGGPGLLGVLFSVDAGGTITTLHDFATNIVGAFLRTPLMRSSSGLLYGMTARGAGHDTGALFSVDTAAPDQVVKVIDMPPPGPAYPRDRMIRASDGHLYGTSQFGGDFNAGTIFRFANGAVTTLHSFNRFDGFQPSGDLLQGSDGRLYGTTHFGGNNDGGMVFGITLSGALILLHAFDVATEGSRPLAGLVEGPDHNFYGTTTSGGPGGSGTVFRMTPDGHTTTLHGFNGADGWSPARGSLVIGHDGFFYGVTREGGATPTNGLAYKIDSDGNFTILHEFDAAVEGAHPQGLTLGTDGNFYGANESGVSTAAFGTLFRMTPAGAVTVLHRFDRETEGAQPTAEPIEAGDGKLYGATLFGGDLPGFALGVGTVYRYDGSGIAVLHTFDSVNDGATPLAGLVQGSDNRLYGLTSDSGGTLYALGVGITNKAPTARSEDVITDMDVPIDITVDVNEPDGNPLSVRIVDDPDHGTLSGTGPTFTYTPHPGYTGPDVFRFRANDGIVSSSVATVRITVTGPANTPPAANDQSVATDEDVSLPITLTASDVDGDPLTFAIVTPPSHGALSGTAPNVIYTPDANYNGLDTFTFTANDGTTDSNVATVSISVNAVNDAPGTVNDSYTTNQNVPLPVAAPGVLANDTDVEGSPLTAIMVAGPAHGTVVLFATGGFAYTPAAGYAGPDSFTYKANDGSADSNVATVSITVQPVTIATTTTLQASAMTVGVLQPVTLVASVATVPPGMGVPGGDVEFILNGTTLLGTVPLAGGAASLTTNGLPIGGNLITARYLGAGTFTGSLSAPVVITVQPLAASSFTLLFVRPNPQVLGSPVFASALVGTVGGVAPTGTVEFYDGTSLVGTVSVSAGLATMSWTPATTGAKIVSARYSGDASFAPSSSPPVVVTIYSGARPAPTTTTLAISPSPSTLGQTVTFTTTVNRAVPIGSLVTFFANGVSLGTAPIVDVGGRRQAVMTVSTLPVGVHMVSAIYLGAPGFAASNSTLALHIVQ